MASNPRFLNRMPGGVQGIHKRTVRDRMADKLSDMIQSSLRHFRSLVTVQK